MEQPSQTPDILFIPPITDPSLRDSSANFIPVGILVLLSCLKESHFHGAIFKPQNPLYFEKNYVDTAKKILSVNPKIVGFSTWCHSYSSALLLAKHIKRLEPTIAIIFGGPQASILDRVTLSRFSYVDYILRGEAEYTIGPLVKALLSPIGNRIELIPGLTYRDRNDRENILVNRTSEVVKSLDELPMPAYQEIGKRDGYKIDVGRGCPFKCSYCTTNQFFSKSYRVKSPQRIINEMKKCYELSGRKTTLGFAHDMFTLNKRFVKELCKKLSLLKKETKEEYKWTCSARTDCVTKELLKLMAESGCQAIFFGIESGSAEIQKRINKNLDLVQAHDNIASSISLGIDTVVSYMAGFPDESKADLEETLRSVLKILLLGAKPQMTLLSVLPGTPIYTEYVNQLKYDGNISGFSGANLSETEVKMIRMDPEIFSSFYYLPNKRISRDLLIFISDLINQLPDFIPTVRLIRKFLKEDISKINFIDYIENRLPDYDPDPSSSPALSFIMDSLVSYLLSLTHKGLPDYIWEIFRVDCIKAYLRIKRFRIKQSSAINPSRGKRINQGPRKTGKIQVSDFSQIVTTNYNLPTIYSSMNKGCRQPRLRKGKYKYLIIAKSFSKSYIYKISFKESEILENYYRNPQFNLSKMNNKEACKNFTPNILKRLAKIGALEIL